jgi:hypothetical protein
VARDRPRRGLGTRLTRHRRVSLLGHADD